MFFKRYLIARVRDRLSFILGDQNRLRLKSFGALKERDSYRQLDIKIGFCSGEIEISCQGPISLLLSVHSLRDGGDYLLG